MAHLGAGGGEMCWRKVVQVSETQIHPESLFDEGQRRQPLCAKEIKVKISAYSTRLDIKV